MLGKAKNIRVKQFNHYADDVEKFVNGWLEDHPDIEVIDIRFSTSAVSRQLNEFDTEEVWGSDALVIYRV